MIVSLITDKREITIIITNNNCTIVDTTDPIVRLSIIKS
jgi:hypothetical protein